MNGNKLKSKMKKKTKFLPHLIDDSKISPRGDAFHFSSINRGKDAEISGYDTEGPPIKD